MKNYDKIEAKYGEVLEKKQEKIDKIQKFCNKCEKNKDNWIKSRKCDHFFCVDCIFESGQGGKQNLNCMVCGAEMMTMNELESRL